LYKKIGYNYLVNKYLILTAVVLGIGINALTPIVKDRYFSNAQTVINPQKLVNTYDASKTEGEFHGQRMSVLPEKFFTEKTTVDSRVLGEKSKDNSNKVIKISLADQKLYLYEGDKKKASFLVSTGLWGMTPTGEFRIWTKLVSTLMAGGSKALGTYYYLPNVPYTMYFYNASIPKTRGYGIHGAYWHNNFGHPMSHGCINMKPEEAKIVYDWASSEGNDGAGTKIVIY